MSYLGLSKICILSIVALCVSARLVFPEGSDVGYVVSDDDNRNEAEIVQSELTNSLHRHDKFRSERDIRTMKNYNDRIPEGLKDDKHGVVMGVKNVKCDNGLVNISRDWDDNPDNHTCYTPKQRLPVRLDLSPYELCENVPRNYYPIHYCMFVPLQYNRTLPTFGPHRPLWPLWGEYEFVPTQRWLHALEHGAIVMLYHPCTEPSLVNELKRIVTGCIFKHVISPYNLLPIDRPLTLMAWGCYIQMSTVDEEIVKAFIKSKSMKGPEGTYAKLGKYTYKQLTVATPPPGSDDQDSVICPA